MGSAAADPSACTPQSKETPRHAKLLAFLPAANLEMRICCAEPSRCRGGMDCSLQLLRHACWSDNPSLMHFTLPGRRESTEIHQWHLRHLADVSARGSVFLSISVTEEMIERMRAKSKPSALLSKFIFGCPADPTQAPPRPDAPKP